MPGRPRLHARRIRRAAAALWALGLLAAVPAGAADFRPCPDHAHFECATVPVPLDRGGGVDGEVPLHVERLIGTGGRSVAWIGLAGGPGQASAALAEHPWRTLAAPVRDSDQVVLFDQRGTGSSGLIDCSDQFAQGGDDGGIGACGRSLGAARAFYTTTQSVADIDAVRRAVGADRVVLVGVSYGTLVAQRYAQAHPSRTAALVLDSTVPAAGVDQWERSTFGAVRRVLRDLCTGGRCPFTADPAADARTVAARMDARAPGAVFVKPGGRRIRLRFGSSAELLQLLLAGDFSPVSRAFVPSALASARRGDWAPLVRLAALSSSAEDDEPQRRLSRGAFLATTCTDTPLPWAPADPVTGRDDLLDGALGDLGDGPFRPFTASVGRAASIGALCATWPATDADPPSGTADRITGVPTLILSGRADLRTPLEDARDAARLVRGARVVSVAGVGHATLVADPSGCVQTAYTRFLTGQAVGTPCAGARSTVGTRALAPTSLAALRPFGAPRNPGKVARAARLTIGDAVLSAALVTPTGGVARVGGLRGGTVRVHTGTLEVRLASASYVPGVRVSGRLRIVQGGATGTVTVTGARLRGHLTFSGASVRGAIGGTPVSATLASGSAVAADPAGLFRPAAPRPG